MQTAHHTSPHMHPGEAWWDYCTASAPIQDDSSDSAFSVTGFRRRQNM